MVKIRTLVPLRHPTTDESFGADQVVDVADDVAAAWKNQGKISLIEDEERNDQAATHYSDVVGRDDVATPQPSGRSGGPQEEEDDENEPRTKRGKK